MSFFQKTLWSEGMFLRPQHFQQQERYLEFANHLRSSASEPFFWGLGSLKVDQSALSIGKLAILEAEGILPDGTPFSFPHQVQPPPALELIEGAVDQRVFLALPVHRPGAEDVSFDDCPGSLARYSVEDATVIDVNSVAGEPVDIQLARPRLRLVLENDLSDAWLGIGLVRVVECRSDRQVVLDPEYMPPVLNFGASHALTSLINEAHGLVRQRADVLAQRLNQPGRGGISEVGEFLLLQLLNGIEPTLSHYLNDKNAHPERLFADLTRWAGELSSFADDGRRPEGFPSYLHDELRASFSPLISRFRIILSAVLEQRAFQIDLVERSYGVRLGQVHDRSLLESAQFVLAVQARVPAETLRSKFPNQIKIGPVDKIRDMVNLHLPGVELRNLPIAPREIPYHAGFHYFELDSSHELWPEMSQSGMLALHIAGEFPGLELQCWAIRQQS